LAEIITKSKIKEVKNLLCGISGCTNPVEKKIVFQLGFSAGFCSNCGNELMKEGLGIDEVAEK
jgi:hypothetical protein